MSAAQLTATLRGIFDEDNELSELPTRSSRWAAWSFFYGWLVLAFLILSGCATPVGVKQVDPQTVHRELTGNVLSSGELSEQTRVVLNRRSLTTLFKEDPGEAIAQLHTRYVTGGNADDLSALVETCFLHAESSANREFYLASAVYAYALLFPENQEEEPSPYDPRFRLACDIYNRSITSAFKTDTGSTVALRGGSFYLPFGYIEIKFDSSSLFWNNRVLVHFQPVAELQVRGLTNRYRWSGIGAPLSARAASFSGQASASELIADDVQVPITALLRIPEPRKQITGKKLHGILEIYDVSVPKSVDIGSRKVPLEVESTASLAVMLAESPVWQMELLGFFRSILNMKGSSQLRALRPYQRGLIPVVMVHGTASSPGRWAEMVNELQNDPIIQQHFQFWFFGYDTGNPIAYSASLLRESLTQAVREFDPRGEDPALHRMVVMGHSQGGLLTKMTVVDSGDKLWNFISKKPMDELDLRDSTRTLLRKSLFVKPLPFVRSVIFIATPHRGSFIAGWRPSQWITRFIKLPTNILLGLADLLRQHSLTFVSTGRIPTSVRDMTPGNAFLEILGELPIAPGVSAHSIIAVKEGMPVDHGHDGVVAYQSAHLADVESEHVVRSAHSCQGHPHTIAEVRRILLEQLQGKRGRLSERSR